MRIFDKISYKDYLLQQSKAIHIKKEVTEYCHTIDLYEITDEKKSSKRERVVAKQKEESKAEVETEIEIEDPEEVEEKEEKEGKVRKTRNQPKRSPKREYKGGRRRGSKTAKNNDDKAQNVITVLTPETTNTLILPPPPPSPPSSSSVPPQFSASQSLTSPQSLPPPPAIIDLNSKETEESLSLNLSVPKKIVKNKDNYKDRLYEVVWYEKCNWPCLIVDVKDCPEKFQREFANDKSTNKIPIRYFNDDNLDSALYIL